MLPCLFVSDLHGRRTRYDTLWRLVAAERPRGVFLGGDLLPHAMDPSWRRRDTDRSFVTDFLAAGFRRLRTTLGEAYPRVFLIPGNDDPRATEPEFEAAAAAGLWDYLPGRRAEFAGHRVYGYPCIPPSPFLLKDWERYDVSRFVDPGCVSPEEGSRTAGPRGREIRHTTIAAELAALVGDDDLTAAILLCHCPPYGCGLDRAGLDGRMVDHVPLDVHIGSIAVQRFIAARQPLLTLHGHVHESRSLTGVWRERFGRTTSCSAAHDGPELCLVRFDPADPGAMTLELVPPPPDSSPSPGDR